MAKRKNPVMEASIIKVLEPSIESSQVRDASSLAFNNGEVEANRMQNDDDGNEEDEWSSSDEEELPVVDNPVDPRNIKVALAKALTSEFTFKGSFSYYTTHDSAPNPCMHIDGFGPLGLPLSPHEAKRLIGLCIQAPFGKNERTIVDKEVRDTWELSPDKIHFENPLWQQWLNNNVIPAVREALGVSARNVTAEIYKLLLYETGSHFLSHQDTEKIPGMFGSIIITLPSAFGGAALHLSHGGQTRVIDLASTSKISTSVLAWYSDVFHSVKPVTSGYRLALSYNFAVSPASANLRPSLPDMSSAVNQLRHVLISWRQARAEEVPIKLVYHLNHQYSSIGLGNMSLKGKDAHILSFLQPIAEELQFSIYIANVELHESGTADDYGGYHHRHRHGCGYGYSSDDDDEHGGMMDVHDSELTVENVVDLNGRPAHVNFTIEEEEEMPFNLSETSPDQEEYEGYQGNYGGTLEYWYRRTALIIFPSKNESLTSGQDPLEYVTKRLEHKLNRGWKPEDRNSTHINKALALCTARNKTVSLDTLLILTRCAIESHDMPLWVQSIRACGVVEHPGRFPVIGFVQAIDNFGFDTMRPIIEEVLRDGSENASRLTLLKGLTAKFRHSSNERSLAWANAQTELVLKVLRPPTLEDVLLLVQLAHDRPLAFLETILPQLESFTSSQKILLGLSDKFIEDGPSQSSANDLVLSQIQIRLAKKMISGLSAVSPRQPGENIEEAMSIVHLINRAGATKLLPSLFSKIKVCFDAISAYEKPTSYTSYLLPLLGQLELARSKSPRLQADTASFSALHNLVSAALEHGMMSQGFISHINGVLAILPHVGGINLLKTSLLPHIVKVSRQAPESVKQFSIALYRSRRNLHLNTPADQENLISIIQHLTTSVIAGTSFNMDGSPSWSQYGRRGNPHDSALRLLQHCFEFGEESLTLCKRVMCRIQPPRSRRVDDWFISWFIPFVTDLAAMLKTQKLSLSVEPFRTLIAGSTWHYVQSIGENKPQGQVSLTVLSRFGCGCVHCVKMKSFLVSGREREEFQEVQAHRTHLEKQLVMAKANTWGLEWHTMKLGSPHRLIVTKPAHMIATGRWESNMAQAKKFVRGLGDEKTLQGIFGDKTQRLMCIVQLSPQRQDGTQLATASSSGQVGKRPAIAESALRPPKKTKILAKASVIDISD